MLIDALILSTEGKLLRSASNDSFSVESDDEFIVEDPPDNRHTPLDAK